MSACSKYGTAGSRHTGVEVAAILGVRGTTTGRLRVSSLESDFIEVDRKPMDLTKLTVVCAERYYKRRVMRGARSLSSAKKSLADPRTTHAWPAFTKSTPSRPRNAL